MDFIAYSEKVAILQCAVILVLFSVTTDNGFTELGVCCLPSFRRVPHLTFGGLTHREPTRLGLRASQGPAPSQLGTESPLSIGDPEIGQVRVPNPLPSPLEVGWGP